MKSPRVSPLPINVTTTITSKAATNSPNNPHPPRPPLPPLFRPPEPGSFLTSSLKTAIYKYMGHGGIGMEYPARFETSVKYLHLSIISLSRAKPDCFPYRRETHINAPSLFMSVDTTLDLLELSIHESKQTIRIWSSNRSIVHGQIIYYIPPKLYLFSSITRVRVPLPYCVYLACGTATFSRRTRGRRSTSISPAVRFEYSHARRMPDT